MTDHRVYGGKPNLLHIIDGERGDMGKRVAALLEGQIRERAINRTEREKEKQPLCMGCVMIALFNASVVMADENGQSRRELAKCMIAAYQNLLANPGGGLIEEIHIQEG